MKKSGVLKRSWEIFKSSVRVIKIDKEILAFSFTELVLYFIVLGVFIFLIIFNRGIFGKGGLAYAWIFLVYLGFAFINSFFSLCITHTSLERFNGKSPTINKTVRFALSKFFIILKWAILSATVGILLKILEETSKKSKGAEGFVLKISEKVFGLAWKVTTVFVIPVISTESVGPFKAIKKSTKILKRTWGESLVRYFGVGAIQMLTFLIGFFVFALLGVAILFINPLLIVVPAGLFVIYSTFIWVFFSSVNEVFNSAIYFYATTGKRASGYSKDILKNAFISRK